jgi:hypothetical protein
MSAGAIYTKTALGTAEIADRKLRLPPRLRTMLILIDGHQPEFLIKEEAEKVGAPADFLDQLMTRGLIEKSGQIAVAANSPDVGPASTPFAPVPQADEFTRFRAAKDFMNITVVDALGIRSFFFTLKLERAGNVADLRELVDTYRGCIVKGEDEAQAEVLTKRLREMLR